MDRLKILLVGSDEIWALEKIYMKYLLQEGVEVELFAAQNLFYAYNERIVNKIKLRTGISGIFRSINRQLRERITAFRPDIIWVFKGMEVMPETLEWIRNEGILVVNYNPDNPFIFTGKGSGNKYISDSIKLYDLHLTYNLAVKKQLEEKLSLRSAFLPFGFDLAEDLFQTIAGETEINRLCFLGNPDSQRAVTIQRLLEAGIRIDLYGNGWAGFVGANPLAQIFPAVYGDEFWKVLRRYRAQLNLMRIHNEDSHNMRSFEVPGAGGIMLAPATTEHKMFFKDGEEAFLYGTIEEGIQKARFILDMNSAAAGRIRTLARQRSFASGYTYQQRVRTALQELRNIHAETGHPSL